MTGNRLKCIVAVFLLSIMLSLKAQTPDIVEGKMNEIKQNVDMIYGEGFGGNKDIAFDNAISDLLITANELRESRGKGMINASVIQPLIKELKYSKNNRHIVMVYMPVSQVFSLNDVSPDVIVSQMPDNQQNQNIITETGSDANAETDPGVSYDPDFSNSNEERPVTESIDMSAHTQPDDVLMTLCSQDSWIEIKGILSTYKVQRKIKETGACTSPDKVPDDAYSILIDEMYGILSILSPKNTPNRINYRTNQPDSESNYPNCKVIVWYK